MKTYFTRYKVYQVLIILIQIHFSIKMIEGKSKRWYIGRTPPSSFEYSRINGFYSPKEAQAICEGDLQCGGFTFKGSKRIVHVIPEIYFFRFINESSSYLTTEIKHPHWTSYIVRSRDHILVSGSYAAFNSTSWRRLNRYQLSVDGLIFDVGTTNVRSYTSIILLSIF